MGGKTYLSRLWCVVEIFTFVHMGGDPGKVTIMKILEGGNEHDDLTAIEYSIERFDAGECDCFNPEDKEKMVRAIRTAFGDTSNFNDAVRSLLDDIGFLPSWQHNDSSSMS